MPLPNSSRRLQLAAFSVLLGGLLVALAPAAQAQQYTGDTTGGPTWNRPYSTPGNSTTGSLGGLSTVGTNTPYQVRQLTVTSAGSYSIAAAWSSWDGCLYLYKDTFDAQSPLINFVVGNDDDVSTTKSRVVASLSTGVDYFVVATGLQNSYYGAYTITITGPASVTIVAGAPTITAIDPAAGTTAGGTQVTLTGTELSGATSVTFNGTLATLLSPVSSTQVDATTPGGSAGAASVVVTTPGGTSAAFTGFTYVAPTAPPLVTSIVPSTGPTTGGTQVTITGANLLGATEVRFGGTLSPSITSSSATTIVCVTPAGTAGAASVAVTATTGTSSGGPSFTYTSGTSGSGSGSVSSGSGGGGGGCAFTGAEDAAPLAPWAALLSLALLLAALHAWRRRLRSVLR